MATDMPTRSERRAAVAEGLFSPLAKRDLLDGLGETISKHVPLRAITRNPNQPRAFVDEDSLEFQELVGTIRAHGTIQPIALLQDGEEDQYTIIAGERRFRAFSRLAEEDPQKYGRIPATVRQLKPGADRETILLMLGLIENLVREDLKEGERAAALARLKEMTGSTYEAIADQMGMTVGRVVALSSIARHDAVREAVDNGRITQKQAILLGQAVKDSDLAGKLVEAVSGLDPAITRSIVDTARELPADMPPAERVHTAVAMVGPRPHTETTSIPLRRNGRVVGMLAIDEVILAATPLAALLKRRKVPRQELAELLQQTCEQLNIWPTQPTT